MAYAGLHQVLSPLLGGGEPSGSIVNDALGVALGFSQGIPPDRLAVCAAALEVVRGAAGARPLLLIVDDVQWLDRASIGVLGFVARRLPASRVGLMLASRGLSGGGPFGCGELPRCDVAPLDAEAAGRLLDLRFATLAHGVRQRVLAEAQGNPLALLELPAVLRDLHIGSGQLLPIGERLQGLFASRVRDLPMASRRLLLLAALDGSGDLGVLHATGSGVALDDLRPAEEAALVGLDAGGRELTFRHPLVRSTVVALATAGERRDAHRSLAAALVDQPDCRAWHTAHGAVGADEQVAGLMEQTGRRALRRGDPAGAVAALLRAADLSPLGSDRSRRLADAAYVGAEVAGDLQGAPRLLDDARKADPERGGSLQAAVTTAMLLLNGEGDVETVHRLLVGAIETRAGRYDAGDGVLVEALHMLLSCCSYGGRPELWRPFHAALGRLKPRPPRLLGLSASLLGDPARATPEDVAELETVIGGLHDEADPAVIVRTGRASLFVDRMVGCREAHWRVVRDGREGGAVTSAIYALSNLCLEDYLIGAWDRAHRLAAEGLNLCEAHGYQLLAWPMWFAQAMIAAGRGDEAATSALTDNMEQWAASHHAGTVRLYARHAQGVAALAHADFETAYHHLAVVSPPGSLSSHVPLALWGALDLVEAAAHTNRTAQAAAHTRALSNTHLPSLSPRLALISRAAAAITTARDDEAEMLFEQALAVSGADRWPFDLARVHLAYGQRQRRARTVGQARTHLTAALQLFERLDAQPWGSRAESELRATSPSRYQTSYLRPSPLTPQEHEIAQLAATGLTNRQIAEKLFLSHRTVGGHLHRISPKLGIATRAALRDALDALPSELYEAKRRMRPAGRAS